MKLPVLLLGFNRPDLTSKVVSALKTYRPEKVYFACDGPRASSPGDVRLVAEVRKEMQKIEAPTQVHTLFREKNLGVREAVVSAIDWFFENEPHGIILEDDCIPNQDFFRFLEHALHKYRDVKRVFGATGGNPNRVVFPGQDSYGFVRIASTWGWGTWSDRWVLFDRDLADYSRVKKGESPFQWDNKELFHGLDWHLRNTLEGWDYQLWWSMLRADGIWVVPRANTVVNQGFRPDALHTKTNRKSYNTNFSHLGPIVDPAEIRVDVIAEQEMLRSSHSVLRPLWLNHLRDVYRYSRKFILSSTRSMSSKE